MLTEVKNKKQIASAVSKRIEAVKINKTRLAAISGLSRDSIYKILQTEGKTQNYSIAHILKICKELGIKIYLEF